MKREELKRHTIAEMKEIIDALEHGKAIQWYNAQKGEWDDTANKRPNFTDSTYRIKPEEPKKKWRPFKDVDEFIKAAGGLGAIWVKRKADNRLVLISSIDNGSGDCIFLTLCWVSFSRLFDCYTFADGTTCGVEEEQK